MEKESQISLWELLFSGQVITSIFVVLIIFLWIMVVYAFFLKYFRLKQIYTRGEDFLDNIADCMYDHRMDSAMDLCKRISSPEARIVRRGLDKINQTPFEIFISVENQVDIESLKIRKNLFKFGIWAKIAVLLGVFGTGISLVYAFADGVAEFSDQAFYTSILPLCLGAFLGAKVYSLKLVLVSLTHKIEENLKTKSNKFLEIIQETNKIG